MDAEPSPARTPRRAQDGINEPANRATPASRKFQTPREWPGERDELRDPFADVADRVMSIAEQVTKDGPPMPVQKTGTEWLRRATWPPRPTEPIDPTPTRDETPEGTTGVKVPGTLVPRLEAALHDRYLIKRVTLTDSTVRLPDDTIRPFVAGSMINVGLARNWNIVRVSGKEGFGRRVWLESAVRGVEAVGDAPNPADGAVLKREQQVRPIRRIEPAPDTSGPTASAAAEKSSPGRGGRAPIVAAVEALLAVMRVPEARRIAVLVAATEQLAQRARNGPTHKAKVYDPAARPQGSLNVPGPETARAREPGAPARAR